MASYVYNTSKKYLMNGGVDLDTDDIRILLTTSTYTPDIDAHEYVSHVTNECTGTGYARKALTAKAVAEDDTNDRSDFTAANLTWSAANFGTPAYAVAYKYNAADSAAILVCAVELSPATATNGGDYTVKWASGATSGAILRLS